MVGMSADRLHLGGSGDYQDSVTEAQQHGGSPEGHVQPLETPTPDAKEVTAHPGYVTKALALIPSSNIVRHLLIVVVGSPLFTGAPGNHYFLIVSWVSSCCCVCMAPSRFWTFCALCCSNGMGYLF
jgi:hypothetical protein